MNVISYQAVGFHNSHTQYQGNHYHNYLHHKRDHFGTHGQSHSLLDQRYTFLPLCYSKSYQYFWQCTSVLKVLGHIIVYYSSKICVSCLIKSISSSKNEIFLLCICRCMRSIQLSREMLKIFDFMKKYKYTNCSQILCKIPYAHQ